VRKSKLKCSGRKETEYHAKRVAYKEIPIQIKGNLAYATFFWVTDRKSISTDDTFSLLKTLLC
jgi:hypothetical protein